MAMGLGKTRPRLSAGGVASSPSEPSKVTASTGPGSSSGSPMPTQLGRGRPSLASAITSEPCQPMQNPRSTLAAKAAKDVAEARPLGRTRPRLAGLAPAAAISQPAAALGAQRPRLNTAPAQPTLCTNTNDADGVTPRSAKPAKPSASNVAPASMSKRPTIDASPPPPNTKPATLGHARPRLTLSSDSIAPAAQSRPNLGQQRPRLKAFGTTQPTNSHAATTPTPSISKPLATTPSGPTATSTAAPSHASCVPVNGLRARVHATLVQPSQHRLMTIHWPTHRQHASTLIPQAEVAHLGAGDAVAALMDDLAPVASTSVPACEAPPALPPPGAKRASNSPAAPQTDAGNSSKRPKKSRSKRANKAGRTHAASSALAAPRKDTFCAYCKKDTDHDIYACPKLLARGRAPVPRRALTPEERLRTVPCQFHQHGRCQKGEACPFSHAEPQVHKQDLCKFFLSNDCKKGDACLYSHDPSLFPCRFYHTGGCDRTDCRFSHEPLTADQAHWLKRDIEALARAEQERQAAEGTTSPAPELFRGADSSRSTPSPAPQGSENSSSPTDYPLTARAPPGPAAQAITQKLLQTVAVPMLFGAPSNPDPPEHSSDENTPNQIEETSLSNTTVLTNNAHHAGGRPTKLLTLDEEDERNELLGSSRGDGNDNTARALRHTSEARPLGGAGGVPPSGEGPIFEAERYGQLLRMVGGRRKPVHRSSSESGQADRF